MCQRDALGVDLSNLRNLSVIQSVAYFVKRLYLLKSGILRSGVLVVGVTDGDVSGVLWFLIYNYFLIYHSFDLLLGHHFLMILII